PLRCVWCHNPESWELQPQMMFFEEPKIVGREMTVEEILKEVKADQSYYRTSGGGITISGGEPMLQFGFLKELLEAAKKEELHVCIETSGFADQDQFAAIYQMVDLFLFDIKQLDSDKHRKYTGVSNQRILSNLDFLYGKGAKIQLRCPMIPGVNDAREDRIRIEELSRQYPDLEGVEFLPYHDMGKGKWEALGKECPYKGVVE
ncbi:MAG: glycyl-radical enzyme activating protein, partial [Vallitaleaceae bacterium]|nr:glycyl-radical enzyme activating protein [Vallitaleaceae bacterium]